MDIATVNNLLSKKERDVFMLALSNLNNKEMATELGITKHGVEFHLLNIYKKTGTKSRIDLISKFVDVMKADKNLLLYVFQLRNDIEELKRRVGEYLPGGVNGNKI